jgi:hypothetical protein
MGAITAGIAVGVTIAGEGVLVVLLVLASLLGFVSTTTVARYLEQRGDAEPEGDAPSPGGLAPSRADIERGDGDRA